MRRRAGTGRKDGWTMTRRIDPRFLVGLLLLLSAGALASRRVVPNAQAQVAPSTGSQTQVKTRAIIRSSVSALDRDTVAQALQQSLAQADAQEPDPVLKGAIEQTLANPTTLTAAADQVARSIGGSEQSATVPVYAVDAMNGTIAVLNLQVTRTAPDTGLAQPSQHDDLRSYINDQLAKDVGDAVLRASTAQTATPGAAADQSRTILTGASVAANTLYDVTTNQGQSGDQHAAAQYAVQQTDQQVLQSLGPLGPQGGTAVLTCPACPAPVP
jgi:hypothetical protein